MRLNTVLLPAEFLSAKDISECLMHQRLNRITPPSLYVRHEGGAP